MKQFPHFFVIAFLLTACGMGSSGELPTPQISVNSAPDAEGSAIGYLSAWNAGNYAGMYAMLSAASQQAISLEDFQARYAMVATQTNLFRVDYEILQSLINPSSAQVAYRVTLNSAVIGPITRDTSMDLVLESGNWRVVWGDHIILPELVGGNTLSLERFVPSRGIIYDHNGVPLAANTEAVAVGVIPSLLLEEDAGPLISGLSRLTGIPSNIIEAQIFPEEGDPPYYVSIAEVSAETFNQLSGNITGLTGVRYEFYTTRLYPGLEAGSQTLGYYGAIPAEEVPSYIPLGYQSDDYIGRMGIEAWAEEYLAGTRGGALYVLNPNGEIVTKISETAAQPASSVYTTLDMELQVAAQEAIKDFQGAIVVLERDTGRVLAMVSSPGFNPNWADPLDYNSDWGSYFLGGPDVFFNRATQGRYPPGSIFKVIPFSAALESGIWQPESTYDCVQEWYGLGGTTPLVDWTLEKELPPSGVLTLLEGLMRSCNPWFYHIGLDLYNTGNTSLITEIAQGFGLGSLTNIQVVPEDAGQVTAPDPNDAEVGRYEAVQQAFGQGSTVITPLQAAAYVAAIGNGGTLYQPQLIERVEDTNGVALLNFEPQINSTLPISENTLVNLQNAMRMVVSDPRGTAYRRFTGFSIALFGKTGTATAGEGLDPHAWFIGYSEAGRPSQPDIAIAVLVENVGDGSEFAAPIFRRVASYYFLGSPGPLYPWESDYGVLDPVYFDETLQAEATATAEAEEGIAVTPGP